MWTHFGGGVGLQHGHFSVKMYMKMKELDPVGGVCTSMPPRSAYAFTPLILRIFCNFLTLFNIIIPKIFQPHFAQHNFISKFDFLFMHIQTFARGFKSTPVCAYMKILNILSV